MIKFLTFVAAWWWAPLCFWLGPSWTEWRWPALSRNVWFGIFLAGCALLWLVTPGFWWTDEGGI